MDLLAGVSIDGFKMLSWVLALAVGIAVCFWPRKRHWAALDAVLVWTAANVGWGIYVLMHRGDARWPADSPLSAPSLSGTPLVGEYLGQLDSWMDGVVNGVNDLQHLQAALAVAMDFFTLAGWGCLAAVPAAAIAVGGSILEQKRRKKEIVRYRDAVDDLQRQLAEVKRFVNYPG
ncbi:hypothetical protein D477_005611 [Arthrobacter crystallopoietes BAB-32]|uniref:Uncharacterized protein n=1 Tax=Arthrobacter crystallopoietes BAB-32 TaxID=1246476 RepID=N1V557_9MICC|nr:hypothetical protein [Arthrobacter crystallopoietes]EMY35217.1 hypothetical protein D477_005611 [Arthrobacter crystallopoietes BAB-32]